jgi:DNA repair protein RadC
MNKLTTVAEIELSYSPVRCSKTHIKSSEDAYLAFKKFFPAKTIALQEMAVVMYLNRNNRILGFYKISSGGMSGTVVDVRLVLATALKIAASGIMMCHNHPSGNLKASMQDLELTQKIKHAAVLMDMKLLDHLIISPSEGFLSFADEGMI